MAAKSKHKGSDFERKVCVALSLWVTVGKSKDCFWRSAMSGGRATVSRGEVRQAGDICAVAPEGHSLTNRFYIECKAYRNLEISQFVVKGTGILAGFWETTCIQALLYKRKPMLIAKQNNTPILMLTEAGQESLPWTARAIVHTKSGFCMVRQFEDVVSTLYRPRSK